MRLATDRKLTREFTRPPNIGASLAMVSNKLRRDTGAVGLDTLMGVLGASGAFAP